MELWKNSQTLTKILIFIQGEERKFENINKDMKYMNIFLFFIWQTFVRSLLKHRPDRKNQPFFRPVCGRVQKYPNYCPLGFKMAHTWLLTNLVVFALSSWFPLWPLLAPSAKISSKLRTWSVVELFPTSDGDEVSAWETSRFSTCKETNFSCLFYFSCPAFLDISGLLFRSSYS